MQFFSCLGSRHNFFLRILIDEKNIIITRSGQINDFINPIRERTSGGAALTLSIRESAKGASTDSEREHPLAVRHIPKVNQPRRVRSILRWHICDSTLRGIVDLKVAKRKKRRREEKVLRF